MNIRNPERLLRIRHTSQYNSPVCAGAPPPTPSFYLSIYPPVAKHSDCMVKLLAHRFIAHPLFSQIIVRYPGSIHAQLVVHAPKRAYHVPREREQEGVGQVNDFVNRVFIQDLTSATRRMIRKERRPRAKVRCFVLAWFTRQRRRHFRTAPFLSLAAVDYM